MERPFEDQDKQPEGRGVCLLISIIGAIAFIAAICGIVSLFK